MNPEEMAELRTLGQIVAHMESCLSPERGPAQVASSSGSVRGLPSAPVAESGAGAAPEASLPGIEAVAEGIMRVVSEKAGYPVEMLELDMEMEADLGIDRVKLVEIIGALRERYPFLGDLDNEALSGLHTLEDLARYVGEREPAEASAGPGEGVSEGPVVEEVVPQGFARLKGLPAPDALEFDMPENHVCLVTDDGTSATVKLAESLVKKGWKVVVMRFPVSTVPEGPALDPGIPRVELKDLTEEHLRETLRGIGEDHGPVGGFIHLNPPYGADEEDEIVFSETAREILLHVFLMAKHLKQSLTQTTPPGRRFFMVVARLDGALGVGGGSYGVVDGGLFGLVKTVNLEWDGVFCRAIDLSPHLDSAQSVSSILQELHDPDARIVETGWGDQGRVTLVAEPLEPIPQVETDGSVDSSSVFVVSGGAKGVTAHCVARLASAYKSKFVLLGRSSFSGEEPEWARDCYDESELKKRGMEAIKAQGEKPTPKKVEEIVKPVLANREIADTLRSIREAGGEAEYLKADVTDAHALEQVVPAVGRLGQLAGVIHGAGVLADRLIEKKTVGDFQAVYSTKVKGLEALLGSVDKSSLRYLILFSSAAGFFGNPGQSDYSMANEILNKVAYQFKHRYPDCHVRTFNWGPWDGGMVSDSLKKMFAERNIQVIPMQGGTKVFVDGFSPNGEENPLILVGSAMSVEGREPDPELRAYRITRKLKLEDNPFLQDHVIGGQPVLPAVCVMAWMADVCEQLYPGYQPFRCEDYKTLKGIVFDGAEADEYCMDLKEIRKTDSGKIEFEVKISSRQPGDKRIHHYSSQIVLLRRIPEAPFYEGFDRTENQAIEGTSLYEDGTLFHGPHFQAVQRVLNISEKKLTLQCQVPEVGEQDQGQFPVRTFNPYAADVQFQSMLIWVRKHYDAGSLPSKAPVGEQYRPIPTQQELYVSLDVKNASKTRMVADITTHDETGKIYTRVLDAEVTISKQLNHLFVRPTSR